MELSGNTEVTLLLTAPLIADQQSRAEILTASEYVKLRRLLTKFALQPADLLNNQTNLPADIKTLVEADRYQQLFARMFELTQAIERWRSRDIWVIGHTDEQYPERFVERLKEHAPPALYGCGDAALLNSGGLAVVGSRNVDPELISFTESVGRVAAEAKRVVVSGGARGIDQASMRGALEAGGRVIGILADSLERAVKHREHRDLLMAGQLVFITTFDPSAGFNVGYAMQRNKLIYALADAALVVNSDLETGGTWAGAVEQLEKYHFVPVYVRASGVKSEGLEALERKGALPWPYIPTAEVLNDFMDRAACWTHTAEGSAEQMSLI